MEELAAAATAVRGKLDDLQVRIAALVKATPFEKPQRAVQVAEGMLALLEVQSRVGELLVAEIRELRAAAHAPRLSDDVTTRSMTYEVINGS